MSSLGDLGLGGAGDFRSGFVGLTRLLGALQGLEGADAAIRANLGHKAWSVRAAAVAAARELRTKTLVGPLIARLRKEDGRIRGDIVAALEDLTGGELGPRADDWERWWESVGGTLELDRGDREAGAGS